MTRTPVEVASGRNEDLTRIHIHTRKEVMRILAGLILGLMVVGCGKTDTEHLGKTDTEHLEEENRRLKAQLENDKLKAELEAKNKRIKDNFLRLSVVGVYEHKGATSSDGKGRRVTSQIILLENGAGEYYENGMRGRGAGSKWSIVNGEIHVKDAIEGTVFRINKDKSITLIAFYDHGKRIDFKAVSLLHTYKKLK